MAGRYFILHKVTDFAPGYFENTAMEGGGVQLLGLLQSSSGSGIGTYTSPPFACEGFFGLVPSWNASTPDGTTVEMQVRVSADGRWSHWFSFGVWSPYISRASVPQQEDDIAYVGEEHLFLKDGMPAADTVQMRVILQTTSPGISPRLYMMAVSTNATMQKGQELAAFSRSLILPSYSAHTRDPAIADSISSLTSLVMMMNRWGIDLLPEEFARIAYDTAAGHFGNLAFLCAAAGCFGFMCNVGYTNLATVKRQVWLGNAVAVRVQYRAQALGAEPGAKSEEYDENLPPLLEGATCNSKGHLVAVHGFVANNGEEMVVLSDPASESDAKVVRHVPLSSFVKMYTGIAVFLRPGAQNADREAPKRRLCQLAIEKNTLRLVHGKEEILPARLAYANAEPFTMCYTLSDDVAYASAAQRKFYYPTRDEAGKIRFDHAAAKGRRMTFYLISSNGKHWVAEKQID